MEWMDGDEHHFMLQPPLKTQNAYAFYFKVEVIELTKKFFIQDFPLTKQFLTADPDVRCGPRGESRVYHVFFPFWV